MVVKVKKNMEWITVPAANIFKQIGAFQVCAKRNPTRQS